jgi:hypothetical protein
MGFLSLFLLYINLMIILYNQYDRYKSLKLSKNMLPNRRLPNGNHHHIYTKAHVRSTSIHSFILKYHNICTYISWGLTRLLDICVTLSLTVTHLSCYVYVFAVVWRKKQSILLFSIWTSKLMLLGIVLMLFVLACFSNCFYLWMLLYVHDC